TSDDSYEFNNDYFEAFLIEEGNYTNLECYDDDYFQLRVKSGYRLHVEIKFENSIGNLDLELYDSSDDLVNSSTSLVDNVESLYYTVSTGILYTIRVFYVDNPNIYNLSVYYSIAPGQKLIEVNDPQKGVTWNEGSTYDITWTTWGNITDVRIELIQSYNKMPIEFIEYSTENDGSKSWTVPDNIMTRDDYYIRVKDLSGGVFGISDVFSINNPSFPYSTLEVITPNATTIWQNGSSYEITWNHTSFPTLVDLYLYNVNDPHSHIALGVDNNGSYMWMVPDSVLTDNDYRIQILSNTTYVPREYSEYFWIVNTNPSEKTLIIESPEAEVEWIAGNQYEISWFTFGDIENVSIHYQLSGGSWITINSSTENTGSYLWTIPPSVESGMEYIIRVKEYGGSESAISGEFTINNPSSGKIYVNNPNSGSQWYNGTSYNITWTSLGTIDKVNISLYNLYGFVYTIAPNIDNYDNYSWTIPNNLTGGLGYYINISDSSDLYINGISSIFHLICDGTPPSSINLLDPRISANWTENNSYDITWEWTGDITNVTIELWDVSSGFIQTIVEKVSNTGSYSWYVSFSPFLPTDNDYYFVIYNPENCIPFDTSAVFTITNDHTINVINPTASIVWEIGKEYEITWTTTGSISNVGITLFPFSGPTLTITSNTTNDGNYMWTIPVSVIPYTDDYFWIYIYEVDWKYLVNDYSDAFSITSTLPSITITSPDSSSIWVKGDTHEIIWSHTGDIDNVDILLGYNST
ncbi:MAG: Ser-Thr-rich GPI-anchored membrane family protein, partial [Candidatus Thorarchaeota archaeon]